MKIKGNKFENEINSAMKRVEKEGKEERKGKRIARL